MIGLYFFMFESREQQKKIESPINFQFLFNYYKPIYANKNLWRHVITYTCFLAALIAYLTSAPFVMHTHFKVSIKYFGLTQLIPFLTYIGGGIVVTQLINTYNLSKIISIGLIICLLSVCYFFCMILCPNWLNVYNYILAISIFLLGFSLTGSPLITLALSDTTNRGGSAALLGLSMAGMASLGSLTMAIFYRGNFNTVALIIGSFILLGSVIYYFMNIRG